MKLANIMAINFSETLDNLAKTTEQVDLVIPELLQATAKKLRPLAEEDVETFDHALYILLLAMGKRVCFTCGCIVPPDSPSCPGDEGDNEHEIMDPL